MKKEEINPGEEGTEPTVKEKMKKEEINQGEESDPVKKFLKM